MKVIKRNQLIILVISLMLITAGYLNFTTANQEKNSILTSTIAQRDDTKLGDAELVSSTAIEENSIENQIIEEQPEQNQITENVIDTAVNTEYKDEDFYFTTSKLERDNMYSQLLETYQEIYNNGETTAEQKQDALNEITKINKTRNAIMIAENLIVAKGIENVVIFVNQPSISVIAKGKEIGAEQVSQIQNIVCRELEANVENIHVSTK